MKPKNKREPRPPTLTNLPATFAEAEEAEILDTLDQWCGRLTDKLNSEAGHEVVRDDMVRQLDRDVNDAASLPTAYIVAMADAGHPPADHALRIFIHNAIDLDRFNNLPVQVRAYAMRAQLRGPLPIGYSSNRSQVVNDFTRDMIIPILIDQIVLRWPMVPEHYSSQTRHSACWLLALVLPRHGHVLKEQQVRRICKARPTIHLRLAELLGEGLPFE